MLNSFSYQKNVNKARSLIENLDSKHISIANILGMLG